MQKIMDKTGLFPEEEEDKDLFEHYRFRVDKGQSLLRIDKFLMARIENASRNKIQQAAGAGNIRVDDEPVKSSYKVKPNDVITILMNAPVRELELIAEDIPIHIVYEDDHLLVVNKPYGMVVHPGYGNYTGTLVNALIYHFKSNPVNGEVVKPLLVHRIDKDTSGLLLVAKNETAQMKLQSQFFHHTIDRKYRALVWGDVKKAEGTIEGNIARSKTNRKVFRVYPNSDSEEPVGKHAVTHYTVIERFGYVSYLECELETGRTHQIRVHMKFLRHPIFNDETYGGDKILRGTTFTKYQQFVQHCFKICPRQALHARSLGFEHPVTGERMLFESELPDDMNDLIEKWRNYAVHRLNDDDFGAMEN
jgi:23S rRNA pseudouridine1911/1915/1917 synthase